MKRIQVALASLVLSMLVLSPALAEDKEKPAVPPGVEAANRTLWGVKVTDEQQAQITKIGESFNEKVAALNAKMDAATPAEMKKAREEAIAAGKKGREVFEAVRATGIQLTDEQKEAMRVIFGERRAVMKEISEAVMAVLTEEQRAAVAAARPMRRKQGT